MTVHVTRNDGVVQDFTRSADHYIKHVDGSLEVIRGGTAPPAKYPVGGWTAVDGDGEQESRGHLRGLISHLVHPTRD
jgi:hypothetical protein